MARPTADVDDLVKLIFQITQHDSNLDSHEILMSVINSIGRGLEFPEIKAERNPSAQARWREYWMAVAFTMQAVKSLETAYCAFVHAGVNADVLADIKLALAASSAALHEVPAPIPDTSVVHEYPTPSEETGE